MISDDKGDNKPPEATYSWALFIFITLLFIILWVSYFLQRNRIRVVHETVVSIFLGLLVGLIIRLTPGEGALQGLVTFDHRYFFNLLLPPIILNSGYDLKRKNFFRNFGSILVFALLGTMISTIIIGVLVSLFAITFGYSGLYGFLDCIIFGAILSSTDPVTILSLFHQVKVDPKLYAIIFGESILNDSVAIVLFSTLGKFRGQEISVQNIFHGIGSFLGVFFGSTMLGVVIALICALLLKNSDLWRYPSLESSIVSLLAFGSYLLSNGIHLSGIVTLLFCGIAMRHYCYDTMSIRSRRTTKYMFRVLSHLSENFVFIYLGITLFTKDDEHFYAGLIIFTLCIIMAARYMSIIPLAYAINWINVKLYQRHETIPRNHQLMLWWAGLRGAIAFALSFDVTGEAGDAVRTTVLVVCVVSVIVLGGTTNYALEHLNIKTGVGAHPVHTTRNDYGAETDSSQDEEDWEEDNISNGLPAAYATDLNSETSSHSDHANSPDVMRLTSPHHDMTHWFVSFDERWIKPIFSSMKGKSSWAASINPRDRRNVEHQGLVPKSGRQFGSSAPSSPTSAARGFFNNTNNGGASSSPHSRQSSTVAKKAVNTSGGDLSGNRHEGGGSLLFDEEFQDARGQQWKGASNNALRGFEMGGLQKDSSSGSNNR